MNAGFYLGNWVLQKTRNQAVATIAAAVGGGIANNIVNMVIARGAWGASAYVAQFTARIGAVGGVLSGVIGLAVGAA